MRGVVLVVLLLLPAVAAQDDHVPIDIRSDGDFSDPTQGVRSGTGTADDPYIIADWRIRPALLDLDPAAAVHIQGTEAHVVLRDLVVEAPFGRGVWLDGAQNVSIDGLALVGQGRALQLDDVRSVDVRDLDIKHSGPDKTAAVLVDGAAGLYLGNVVVADGDGPGVLLRGLDNARVEGLQVSGHDGGLTVHGSRDVTLIGLRTDGNDGDGTALYDVQNLRLLGLVSDGQTGQGLASGRGLVVHDVTGELVGITVRGNHAHGAKVWDSQVTLQAVRALDNGAAGVLAAVPGLRIDGMEAHGNRDAGLSLFAPLEGPAHAQVSDLQSHDNGGPGLFAQDLVGLHVERLRAEHNGAAGIDVRDTANVTVLDSVLLRNEGPGLYFDAVRDAQVVDNQANDNRGDGFALRASARVLLRNNTALENGGVGFAVNGTGVRLQDNQAEANGLGAFLGTEEVQEESPAPLLWLPLLAVALRRRASGRAGR